MEGDWSEVAPQIATIANLISAEPAALFHDELAPLRDALVAAGATLPPPPSSAAASSGTFVPAGDAATGRFGPGAEASEGGRDLGLGCYLVLEEVNQGTMFIHWAEHTPPGANVLAFCRPGKPVAKFKFTQNGGKKEHVKGPLMGPQIKNYYRGWVMFMKLVRENAGELIIAKDVGDVALFTNSELAVKKLGVHKSHALDAADAWAAMPPHTMAFNVQQMATDMFASKGNAEGYAMCVNH